MSRYNRGDILHADLDPTIGSEQAGSRPVVVIQKFLNSSVLLIAPITSRKKGLMRTHVSLKGVDGLDDNSIALLEQMRSIDRERVTKIIGTVPEAILEQLIDTYDTMGNTNFEREPILLTLCRSCKEDYRDAKRYLERADFKQPHMETCMLCNDPKRKSWDYFVYSR